MQRPTGSDLVGDDGLLTYEEIVTTPLLFAAASAGLLAVCATAGWVLQRILSRDLDYAWDTGYWRE